MKLFQCRHLLTDTHNRATRRISLPLGTPPVLHPERQSGPQSLEKIGKGREAYGAQSNLIISIHTLSMFPQIGNSLSVIVRIRETYRSQRADRHLNAIPTDEERCVNIVPARMLDEHRSSRAMSFARTGRVDGTIGRSSLVETVQIAAKIVACLSSASVALRLPLIDKTLGRATPRFTGRGHVNNCVHPTCD